jgi:hypothetical protein
MLIGKYTVCKIKFMEGSNKIMDISLKLFLRLIASSSVATQKELIFFSIKHLVIGINPWPYALDLTTAIMGFLIILFISSTFDFNFFKFTSIYERILPPINDMW